MSSNRQIRYRQVNTIVIEGKSTAYKGAEENNTQQEYLAYRLLQAVCISLRAQYKTIKVNHYVERVEIIKTKKGMVAV